MERLTLFSDGIFAFAITLLAVDIRVPDLVSSLAGQELNAALIALTPKLIGFGLSFWIAGSFWIFYHHVFRYIKHYDRPIIMLNLLFLMFIVLIPFPSDLLSRFPSEQTALVIYSTMMGATGTSLSLIWHYASWNHRLTDPDLSGTTIRRLRIRTYISPVLFLASIPVTYLYPALTIYIWVLTWPVTTVLERLPLKA
jgi:uncharacterized membrane protein